MIFPSIPTDNVPAVAAEAIGRVPAFSAKGRCFLVTDGALQERCGREAVRQWFDLMLRQRVGAVPIYRIPGPARIGIDLDLLSGRLPAGLAEAEIERNVRETASFNPAVRAVQNFEFLRSGRNLTISFVAVLHDGDSVEVIQRVR